MYSEKIINNHIIFYNDYKYNSKQEDIENFILSDEFNNFTLHLEGSYNIILGGDGTMLQAIKNYHKNGKKFIGINFGNKGFLLQDKSIISEKLDFIDYNYSLFDIYINGKYSTTFTNEINITASAGKIGEYQITIGKDNEFILKGDGLLISSILGSTAYNNSLGGPILLYNTNSIVLTAKAPYIPKGITSLVLNENEEIQIKNIGRYHGLEVYSDGIGGKIDTENTIIEIRKSKHPLILTINKNKSEDWKNKIYNF